MTFQTSPLAPSLDVSAFTTFPKRKTRRRFRLAPTKLGAGCPQDQYHHRATRTHNQ